MTDPANQQFLDAVVRGECPAELGAGGQEPVHVNLLRYQSMQSTLPGVRATSIMSWFKGHATAHCWSSKLAEAAVFRHQ